MQAGVGEAAPVTARPRQTRRQVLLEHDEREHERALDPQCVLGRDRDAGPGDAVGAELGPALREVVHLLGDALVVEEAGLVAAPVVRGLHPLGVRRPERDHAVLELGGARHGHGLRGGVDGVIVVRSIVHASATTPARRLDGVSYANVGRFAVPRNAIEATYPRNGLTGGGRVLFSRAFRLEA